MGSRLFRPRPNLVDRWNDTDYDTEISQPNSTDPSSLHKNKILIYDDYEDNPCASNDSGNNYLAPCTYTEPQTKFLSCIADNENELLFSYGASATTFEYDYEIHTPFNTDVALVEAVDEFQNGLAGSIAADFGVYCDKSARILGKEFYMNTTDDAIGGGGEYAPVCLGVSSSPSDVPDEFISKFKISSCRNVRLGMTYSIFSLLGTNHPLPSPREPSQMHCRSRPFRTNHLHPHERLPYPLLPRTPTPDLHP